MGSLNKKATVERTHNGGHARTLSLVDQLERSVMCCMLWEDGFYENGETIASRIETLVNQIKDSDKVVDIMNKAKFESKLRHIPLFLAVELMKRTTTNKIKTENIVPLFTRPDDMIEMLSLYWRNGKTPLAKCMVRAMQEGFLKFDEYQLAKYRKNNKAIKLRDVLKLVRPKPKTDEQSELWKRLKEDTLVTPDTWEVAISACKTSEEKKAEFERLLRTKKLGGLAFLRNLRLMSSVFVDEDLIRSYFETANFSLIIPYQFINAALHAPQFEPELEKAMFAALENHRKFSGKVKLLVDVSGSMSAYVSSRSQATCVDVASSLAILLEQCSEHVDMFTFNTQLNRLAPRKGFALRDSIVSKLGGGTHMWGSVDEADKIGGGCNLMIVVTDEQTSDNYHPTALELTDFLVIINVCSNKNGVRYGKNTLHINGWSESVIKYIQEYIDTYLG